MVKNWNSKRSAKSIWPWPLTKNFVQRTSHLVPKDTRSVECKIKEGYRIYDQFGKDFTRTCKYDLTLTHIHRT